VAERLTPLQHAAAARRPAAMRELLRAGASHDMQVGSTSWKSLLNCRRLWKPGWKSLFIQDAY
jgi:hypothetical protein